MSELHPPSDTYHLKIDDNLPHMSFARCNSKSSHHWIKYKIAVFVRGEKFNTATGKFEKISGSPCKRCLSLLPDEH